MPAVRLALTPVRPAVRSDAPCSLDLLVTVAADGMAEAKPRPPLNLGLALDRSGSMAAARKIGYAREAASQLVRQLGDRDRVSLTVFDDKVDTPRANGPAADRDGLLRAIAAVEPGGSTHLHGGWREGGRQVQSGFVRDGLNRVLLLSDGLANVGLTDADAIATDVHKLHKEGVGTTTLGLGDDYNELLLEAMARAGDGNYYYVEDPEQLPAILAAELSGLAATVGRDATLTVEPGPGVTVADRLNDLDSHPDGRLKLPTLVAGQPVQVVLRLNVPPAGDALAVCTVTLGWTAPDGTRHTATTTLSLPAVSGASWHGLAPVVPVQERAAVLLVARSKRAASAASAAGDHATAKKWLAEARAVLAAAPATPELARQAAALARVDHLHQSGQHAKFLKRSRFEAYSDSHSKPLR